MPRRWLPLLLCCTVALALPFPNAEEVESDESRRVLGSSVVTSVSVIMDLGNGTKKYFADAAGRPVPKPTAAAMVGSPAGLLNPDRYEFYTFDEAGDLVKRLMTLEEIQSIIANGESDIGEPGRPNYYHQNLPGEPSAAASSTVTDKVAEETAEATDMGELSPPVPGVHDVVASVQNVLKSELEASKNKTPLPKPTSLPPSPSTVGPLSSSSAWDKILPGMMSSSSSNTQTTTEKLSISSSVPTERTTTTTQRVILTTTPRPTTTVTTTETARPAVASDLYNVEEAASSVDINKLSHSPTLSTPTQSPSSTSSVVSTSVSPSTTVKTTTTVLTTKSPTSASSPPLATSSQSPSSTASLVPSSTLQSTFMASQAPLKISTLTGSQSQVSLISASSEEPSPRPSSTTSLPTTITYKTSTTPSTTTTKPKPANNFTVNIAAKPTKPSLTIENVSILTGNVQGIESNPTASTTHKPIYTTFKIPLSSSTTANVESTSAITRKPEASSVVPVTQKVIGISTTMPPRTSTTKFTTNITASTASTVESSSTQSQSEEDYAAAQAFVQLFTPINKIDANTSTFSAAKNPPSTERVEIASTVTKSTPVKTTEQRRTTTSTTTTPVPTTQKENITTRPQKPYRKPVTTTDSSATQTRKPTKPLRTTPSPTKTTQPPRISTFTVTTRPQTTSSKPSSSPIINEENPSMSTIELLKTTGVKIKQTTTQMPPLSTTKNNEIENLLINEASGFIPTKIESPVGVETLPTENLDMPFELAESVLGVLSQVADVEGAATTIDYGDGDLFFTKNATSSTTTTTTTTTTTQKSVDDSSVKTSITDATYEISTDRNKITTLANNMLTTEITKKLPIKVTTQEPVATDSTSISAEANQQNTITTEFVTETTSRPSTSLIEKESSGQPSTVHVSTTQEQSTTDMFTSTVATTVQTDEVKLGDKVENNNSGSKTNEEEDIKKVNIEMEKVNKLGENKVTDEIIKEKIVQNINTELLAGASTNQELLKTNAQASEKKPERETSTTSDLLEKSVSTTEHVVTTTTPVSSETSVTEIEITSTTETTVEEERFDVKTVTEASASNIEETSITTKASEEETSATEITSFVAMDTTEFSTQTTKESPESSTIMLTKYKKEDNDIVEESVQSNTTLKPSEVTTNKIGTENSYVAENEDSGRTTTTTVIQETTTVSDIETTQVSKIDTTTQKEEPTTHSASTEILQSTKNETILADKQVESSQDNETKIKISVAGMDLTPADNFEDDFGLKTVVGNKISTEKPDETTTEITTEVTTEYKAEIMTERFPAETEVKENVRDEEKIGATLVSTTEDGSSERIAGRPTFIGSGTKVDTITESNATNVVQKKEEIEVEILSQRDDQLSSTTVRVPASSSSTPGSIAWTKVSSSRPDDRVAAGSTRRPIVRVTTTEATTPTAEILKVSGLNEDSVKDNRVKGRPQEPQDFSTIDLEPAPKENLGLEASTVGLDEDVRSFAELCNELAFRLWAAVTAKGMTTSRSLIMSPFAVTSLLAMVFLGARGPTSGQMNDILRLDDMVTFNPHQVFKNVTESVALTKNQGIATAAFVRELYSDRSRGRLLDFYKQRAEQFYDGHVEEANFSNIGDLVRRRTNLLIKRQTRGKVPEYLRGNSILLRPPLAVFSANIFQTDCSQASTHGRDGEMYFTVTPAMRQRRLVPVPAVVWFSGFLAGYDPILDATAASVGTQDSLVSLILVLPGQQGQTAPGDGLQRLETRLIDSSYRRGAWSRLLRSLVHRPGLELQLPRFSHRSLLNVTAPLQRMGLRDLFSAEHADLRGINGLASDLHLADIVQVNTFSTCAEDSRHHVEVYPTSPQRSGRDELDEKGPTAFDDLDDLGLSSLPLALRPRQARLPNALRLKFDRPFLYFLRHNPTGLILHMGRFNPRILH